MADRRHAHDDPQLPHAARPRRPAVARELAFARDLGALAVGWRRLLRPKGASEGASEAVVVAPGYGTTDRATWLLRRVLRAHGYRPFGWGLGRNHGGVGKLVTGLRARVDEVADAHGPVHLVGWSWGGVVAREVARGAPEHVRQVVTLGTPILGGAKYTAFAAGFERRGSDLDAIEAQIEARLASAPPIEVPVTSVFTRGDGIVDWRASIDRHSPNTRHLEVRTSHFGLCVHPDAIALVVELLAAAR